LKRIVILGSGFLLRSTSCILAVVLSKSITQEMTLYRFCPKGTKLKKQFSVAILDKVPTWM
jgi:hypothetical protein